MKWILCAKTRFYNWVQWISKMYFLMIKYNDICLSHSNIFLFVMSTKSVTVCTNNLKKAIFQRDLLTQGKKLLLWNEKSYCSELINLVKLLSSIYRYWILHSGDQLCIFSCCMVCRIDWICFSICSFWGFSCSELPNRCSG